MLLTVKISDFRIIERKKRLSDTFNNLKKNYNIKLAANFYIT